MEGRVINEWNIQSRARACQGWPGRRLAEEEPITRPPIEEKEAVQAAGHLPGVLGVAVSGRRQRTQGLHLRSGRGSITSLRRLQRRRSRRNRPNRCCAS